ncbi:MAG: dienelactone hydrolase family protein [Betaproteobacteria bacterium]|nr:dienelactone hydrolase family protein [Betaproteobacteria bacterium]
MPTRSTPGNRLIGKTIDIPTGDGTMDGYAAHPDGAGRFALVVLFMDIWGLREELFAIARRVAAQGYYCVVPNLYYRKGKLRYERRNAAGKMVSFDTLPAALQEEMRGHTIALNRQTARADIAAILDFCRAEPVDDGAAGSVGLCLGGRFAFHAAQEFPERFRANASLHGTWLVSDAADSPHRLAHLMRGEIYCGYGGDDRFAAPAVLAELARVLGGRGDLVYRFNIHAGAGHGYALPDRDIHDHAAAELDWREIFAMFERQLGR